MGLTQKRRSSLRIPLRRSLCQLTKMQGLQSDKRRRLSAMVLSRDSAGCTQVGSGSGVSLEGTVDIQQPIVQTVAASDDKQDLIAHSDGLMSIGQQMLAARNGVSHVD